jgi:nitroreductase
MLTDTLFTRLVEFAAMAPSSDNMQPWEFRNRSDAIEVYCVEARLLTIDVGNMFTWISLGAAIQNVVTSSAAQGLQATIEYCTAKSMDEPVAIMKLSPASVDGRLAAWIPHRRTNRRPFQAFPMESELISGVIGAAEGIDAGIHWINSASDLSLMAEIDIDFSSILLEDKALFDGLFDTIRFTRAELEVTRLGMDLKSLEIPSLGFAIARVLKRWKISRIIGRLGIGRIVARTLSSRLVQSSALFLITTPHRDPAGYMEAGRAMEQLWLSATSKGLSVHPYGVIPQYLTMAELIPDTFQPRHTEIINGRREPFSLLFPSANDSFPAVMLRMGLASEESPRNDVRLAPNQIIRS